MDLSHVSVPALKQALALVEKRESILSELKKVEAALTGIGGALPTRVLREVVAKKAPPAPAPAKPSKASKVERVAANAPKTEPVVKRGALGERVISILKAAGANSVAVTDIAAALAVPAANLHVWFSTAGKKNSAIRKVGRGTYVWSEQATPVAPVAPEPEAQVAEPAEEPEVEVIEVPASPAVATPEPVASVAEATSEEFEAPEIVLDPVEPEPEIVAIEPDVEEFAEPEVIEVVTAVESEPVVEVEEFAAQVPVAILEPEVATESPDKPAPVTLDLFGTTPAKNVGDTLPAPASPASAEATQERL